MNLLGELEPLGLVFERENGEGPDVRRKSTPGPEAVIAPLQKQKDAEQRQATGPDARSPPEILPRARPIPL